MPEGIAPWVQGAEPAKYFAPVFGEAANAASRKAQLGVEMMRIQSQAAQHQAQMQAEHERAVQDIELRKQIQQQNALMDQQRLEIERQYKQQQTAINMQKAQEAAKKNQMALMATIRQQAGQQAVQDEVTRVMQANPQANEQQIRMQALARHPEAMTPASYGSMMGRTAPLPQTSFAEDPLTKKRFAVGPRGTVVQEKEEPEKPNPQISKNIAALERQISQKQKILDDNPKMKENLREDMQKQMQGLQRQVNSMNEQLDLDPPYPDVPDETKASIQRINGKLMLVDPSGKPAAAPVAPVGTPQLPGAPPAAAPGPSSWLRPTPPGFGGTPPAPQAPSPSTGGVNLPTWLQPGRGYEAIAGPEMGRPPVTLPKKGALWEYLQGDEQEQPQ